MRSYEAGRDVPLSWLLGWSTAWAYGDDCPHYWPRLGTREDRVAFLDGVADAIAVHEGSRRPLGTTWRDGATHIGPWDVYLVAIGSRWQWYARRPGTVRTGEAHVTQADAMAAAERALRGEEMR